MRCCALGIVKKYGKAFGVVAVSIVFGLIHGNIIQFIFATLVGLILGYVTRPARIPLCQVRLFTA